jgi:hypothetical protein
MKKESKLSAKELAIQLQIDPNLRTDLFKKLLKHVKDGFSLDCFSLIGYDAIQKYLKEYPLEFVQEELDTAIREAKGFWEGIGRDQSIGKCMGNSRAWYYNMVNRYGWRERVDVKADVTGSVSVEVINYASKKGAGDSEGNAAP